jgi:hypothetical protein
MLLAKKLATPDCATAVEPVQLQVILTAVAAVWTP